MKSGGEKESEAKTKRGNNRKKKRMVCDDSVVCSIENSHTNAINRHALAHSHLRTDITYENDSTWRVGTSDNRTNE